jgi:membrane-bound inhibitor of C-type lysozyme
MRRFGFSALLACAPALGMAQDQPPQQRAISVTYLCAGGAVLQASFINLGAMSAAVVAWRGELIPLRGVETGSGVFYADFDEQRGFRWRGQGDEGFFARLEPDHTAAEEVLLADCKAASAR